MIIASVGNYGSYNSGNLLDFYITLPMDPAKLSKRLFDFVNDPQNIAAGAGEEFYISDILEGDLAGYEVPDYASIENLNLLAYCLEGADLDAVRACIEYNGSYSYTMLDVCNLALQSSNIAFYRWEFTSAEVSWKNGAERMGYEQAALCDLYNQPGGAFFMDYFDFEAYGEYIAADNYLNEKGYLLLNAKEPDLCLFNRFDIEELLEQEFQQIA